MSQVPILVHILAGASGRARRATQKRRNGMGLIAVLCEVEGRPGYVTGVINTDHVVSAIEGDDRGFGAKGPTKVCLITGERLLVKEGPQYFIPARDGRGPKPKPGASSSFTDTADLGEANREQGKAIEDALRFKPVVG
jgi:hypothetical protein